MSSIALALPQAMHSFTEAFALNRLQADLEHLCSAAFTGRRIGTTGHDLAQAWLLQQLTEMGLDTRVILFSAQSAVLNLRAPPQFQMRHLDGTRHHLEYRREFQEHPQSAFQPNVVEGVVYYRTPRQGWIITESLSATDLLEQWVKVGVVGILLPQHAGPNGYLPKRIIPRPRLSLPVISVREDILVRLEGHTIQATMPLETLTVRGGNVLGYLPGTDLALVNEPLIVGAHFDGVGDDMVGYRIPGAADNAAGVAVILELARVLSQWESRPYRPIIFTAFDGEEINAAGSHTLAQSLKAEGKNPIVMNLDSAAQFHEAVWAELSENAELLIQALDQAGEWLEIPLITGNVGSDNRRYAQAGFQTVGLALGGTGGHTPADVVENVDLNAMSLAGRLLLATIWQLAFQPG